MKTSRAALIVGLASVSAASFGLPAFVSEFQKAYPAPKGSALEKAGCVACHVGRTAKLNPYGADLKSAMKALKTKKLTPDALKKIEALDSDKDGVKNIAEITVGTLPGDPKSK